jgi:hypothetical protein
MKRDREFDEILNECIEQVFKGEPIEACLATYPEHAAELKPLLQTALDTRQAAAIMPRPEFRQRAAYEFQAAVRNLGQKRRKGFRWQVRLVTALSVIVIILMAGTGTVAAASNSLPDQALYPVKLVTEDVQVALTPSALGKAELYAEFADRRVEEIVVMADEGKVKQVEKATARMNDHLAAIANLSLATSEPVASVEETPAALMATGSAAAPPVPASTPPIATPSIGVASVPAPVSPKDQGQGTASANRSPSMAAARPTGIPSRVPVPVPTTVTVTAPQTTTTEEIEKAGKIKGAADLRDAVSKQAEKNTQRLEEVLKKAPDNVKPALKKAIDDAGKGYDEALKNMGRKK